MMKMKKFIFISLIALTLFTSCENQEWEFPDYKYTTVYFSYQYPVRTIVLGEDIYDNSLDNAHKCLIMATMGGVYENTSDRIIDVEIDNTLFDSLLFNGDSGKYILPMPANYYTLAAGNKITIPAGSISGGIEVQLTDAFFADPKSITNTYVIPLKMKSVTNADSVLRGKRSVENPNLFIASDWSIAPKDYVLYCVKYINPWHGAYLRRGLDVGTGNNGNNNLDTTIVYHKQYVEKDQVVKMYTVTMNEVSLLLSTRDKGNTTDLPFELRIKVDNNGTCNLAAPENSSYSVSGNGRFVNDGDMWGDQKRDVMYLKYTIDFGSSTHSFTDTLVVRDRQVAMEIFTPVIPN